MTSADADASNIDPETVRDFGEEWDRFDQSGMPREELEAAFESYFRLFPWGSLPPDAEGFDLGCGSGRWAALVAPRVRTLHCIDASDKALAVARRTLAGAEQCVFHHASVDTIPLADASMDFGYSLGVLHHVPDTTAALAACTRKLKRGAPLLVYLYYRFDNRPRWFRELWRASDAARRVISRLPTRPKTVVSELLAATVYWPLAKLAAAAERAGVDVAAFPLSAYRHSSFYTMRTDSLDRFGTRLEQRFTAAEIRDMMTSAGLEDVVVGPEAPYWCAIGRRA